MNAIVPVSESASAIAERVIINGDLSKLTAQERVNYYREVCGSVGLNPLTKPFEYITLNGKLTLYALRGCTDQLRGIYKVSVQDMAESEREGVYIVTVKVANGEGRTDMAKGAVNIQGLKGEALANAMMKAETKAKRRATLSLCGLGWLDETEVETIPNAVRGEPANTPALEAPPQPQEAAENADVTEGVANWLAKQKATIDAATALPGLYLWLDEQSSTEGVQGSLTSPDSGTPLDRCKRKAPEVYKELVKHYQARIEALNKA